MKPVLVFRHAASEGPGYFATFLERSSIPWRMVALDAGEPVPRDVRPYSGLAFMGGPMSANDTHVAWIGAALELIRDAVRNDVPLLGHCLGGQLIAKALGGSVRANPVGEIGWGEVRVCDNAVARQWLGDLAAFSVFHWHEETFSIPPGATRILEGEHCPNQAFAVGKHLGMQCHVEMTEELVHAWLRDGREEIEAAAASPAVQHPGEIERDLGQRLQALHAVAARIYQRWSAGLSRGS
jgi:GMP synthase-like glutamine amidotransferase